MRSAISVLVIGIPLDKDTKHSVNDIPSDVQVALINLASVDAATGNATGKLETVFKKYLELCGPSVLPEEQKSISLKTGQ